MALKVVVRIGRVEFDGTTITIPTSIRAVGQDDDVTHAFTGVATSISTVAAMVPFLKTQIINYALSEYGATVVDTEIAIFGAPQ